MQEKMQKNTISNISIWLSNKLSGNDLWTNGSICSQLNKEVLRNIKEIFTDLQTQVKLKLLLSFFHIPRRLIDEWKNELDEILEVAAQDPELWVSMLSESMKTYPATGSLNTEISDYDHESRPIFTDMVTELKRLVNKANDLRALPLECQYLNKPALTALVGNQPTPVKHFVLKRKPKSSNLRMELMQKSADAQSSLKKTSAPTVPLRSRGLPRKMTDTTTPLKGIPSRVPSSGGFKTPTQTQSKNASAISRTTPAGRKDGGVKFLEIEDQPLGYAAAKKRKRQQELEEQQKRAAETEQQQSAKESNATNASATPDYAAGLTSVYSQPATPMPAAGSSEINTSHFTTPTTPSITVSTAETSPTVTVSSKKGKNSLLSPKRMKFEDDIEEVKSTSPTKLQQQELPTKVIVSPKESVKGETKIVKVTRTLPTLVQQNATSPPKSIVLTQTTQSPTIGSSYVTIKAVSAANSQQSSLSHLNIPSNTIVRTVQYVTTQAQAQQTNSLVASTAKSPPNAVTIQKPTLIAKTNAAGKPTILSNIVLTPNIRAPNAQTSQAQGGTSYVISSSPSNKIVQRVVVSSGQNINIPTLTTRTAQPTIIQPIQQGTPTKIVQIKTTPTILGMAQNQNSSTIQNIPPLISTQQPTLLNIQNIQNPAQRKTVTLTAQPQTTTTSSQQNQQGQKLNQIIVPSGGALKGKTFIVSNQNQNQQINLGGRNVILQSVGASGTPIYQQIPISSVSNQNVPQLVLANTSQGGQTQTVPRLITNIAAIQPQSSASNQVQIRPVLTAVPQGGGQLTLIQRPGQQAQLVQQIVQPQALQKTIITRPAQVVQVQQTQQATQQGQTTIQANAGAKPAGTAAANNAAGQRRGLSLSSKHVAVASEMFKKANRVTRLDKALILGFMAGYRDNPRPNADNVITIKLNESKEQVKQPDNTIVPMLVDTLIRLDYNTGEWKTFRTFRKITQQQQNEAAAQQQSSQSSVAT